MFSNVIFDVTISCHSFVVSQSCVKVSASLADVGSLAVVAFVIVNCSLTIVVRVPVLNVGK